MNTIRLKVRRTRSISRKHLTEAFCGIVDLREHVLTSARYIRHVLNCAAIRNIFSLSRFYTRTLERSGRSTGNTSRFDRVHIMQVHRRGDALHLRRTLKTCEYSPSWSARYFTIVALRAAFVRVNLSVSSVRSFGPSESTNLISMNEPKKDKS